MKKLILLLAFVFFLSFVSAVTWTPSIIANSSVVSNNSLYAYYSFQDTNNTVMDSSGNKFNSNYSTAANSTFIEKAKYFNSTTLTTFNIASKFYQRLTITAWINVSSFSTRYFVDMGYNSNNGSAFIIDNANLTFRLFTPSIEAGEFFVEVQNITNQCLGKFCFVVATYNGTNATLYINNVTLSSKIFSNATANPVIQNFQLKALGGSIPIGATTMFNGTMDEVSIWNRTLSSSELSTLYRYYLGLFPFILTENSQTYTTPTYEGSSENYIINASYNYTAYSSIIGTLVYTVAGNTTRYTPITTVESTGTLILNASRDIPVTAGLNGTFYWEFLITNSTTSIYLNSSMNKQVILTSLLTDCAEIAGEDFNRTRFNFYEEENGVINASYIITPTWKLSTTSNQTKSYSTQGTNQSVYMCSNVNKTFTTDYFITLFKSGYRSRSYYLNDLTLTPDFPTINLYLLNDSRATEWVLLLKDAGLNPVSNYVIKIYRIATNSSNAYLVESQETDDYGQATVEVVTGIDNTRFPQFDVRYNIEIYNTLGVLTKSLPNIQFICYTSPCRYEIILRDIEDIFGLNYNTNGLSYNLSFNNNTNRFLFVWVDNTGDTAVFNLLVKQRLLNGTTITCNQNVTAISGTMFCDVGSSRASYTAEVVRYVGTASKRLDMISTKVGSLVKQFGKEGLFVSFILLMTCILVGVFYPPASIILYLAGLFLLSQIDVVYMNPYLIFAEVAIGGVFIWLFRG